MTMMARKAFFIALGLFTLVSLALGAAVQTVKWNRVFHHDTSGGLFSSDSDALLKNSDKPHSKLFSILGQLEGFNSKQNYFHLRLCYPELTRPNFSPCNEWIQTSNPATEATITGFKAITLAFPGSSVNVSNQCPDGEANPSTCPWMQGYSAEFSGLGVSPRSSFYTFIDDVPHHINWWYAVGAKRFFSGTQIPGPHGTLVKKVELFIEDTRGYPDSNQYYQPPPRQAVTPSNRPTRPTTSRPCTFRSDCRGDKAQCQRNKCVTPSDTNFKCDFTSECYNEPKVDCQRNKCVTPSMASFKCTFRSDCLGDKAQCQRNKCVTPSMASFKCTFTSECYNVPKVDCQRNKCVDPSMASFKCVFDSDCFRGDDCVRGKCYH